MNTVGRNDPCPCGSGKKFKQCCAVAGKTNQPVKQSSVQDMNAAFAHFQAGRLQQAHALYQKILAADPDNADALHYFGLVAFQAGKPDIAVNLINKSLSLKPKNFEAHNNLGNIFKMTGRPEQAIGCYQNTLLHKPNHVQALYSLGDTYQDLERYDEAITCYRKALALKKDFAEVHQNLGLVYKLQGKFKEAIASLKTAVAIKPDYAEAHYNLGVNWQYLGDADAAIASYKKALKYDPTYKGAYSNMLFLYAYQSLLEPEEFLQLARNWESCIPYAQSAQFSRQRNQFQPGPLEGRRLRVGYVSADFRQHAVSFFIEQLFALHDRSRIEVFAYSATNPVDAVTDRLRQRVEHWVQVAGQPDHVIANRIVADGIDVLVDMSGHTALNCLGVFALRAAPVQTHYLGFFATTGLANMDYWIGDEVITPADQDNHFSETVFRMPRIWVCYDQQNDLPVSARQPAADGTLTLGSFNNLDKINPATLALWAKILLALPEARLLLKTKQLGDQTHRQRITTTLLAHGITADRIDLQDGSATPDWPSHMAFYDHLDIALDPVGGVGGGTTTCDALWMAVPVITLRGDRMASRMSASMLNAIGHPEWIAETEDDYIDKVVALARNVEQRKALRPLLRGQMAQSPLCNAGDLATNLEKAYSQMYLDWLASC